MPARVIGIDGGGSHTTACLVDADAGVLGEGHAGPSNLHGVGLERAVDSIVEAARAALAANPRLRHPPNRPAADLMVCCLSGAGREAEQRAIHDALARLGLAHQVHVDHDAAATLASGGVLGPGIAVIAGTGSFVWGRNAEGRTARADGWGALLGDTAGAFHIALAALRAVCACHDGRGSETRLLELARGHYGVASPVDLIARLATPEIPRTAIAAFAPCVFQAAELMDPVAVAVIDEAVGALVAGALAVRRSLFAPDAVTTYVLGGRLAREQPIFQERFAVGVHAAQPSDTILCPEDSLALGAARIGFERLGRAQAAPGEPRPLDPFSESDAVEERRRVFAECRDLPTEQRNPAAAGIDAMTALDIVRLMNREDARIAPAIEKVLPQVAEAVERIVAALGNGGRLFYVGAGTSGRLGCLDASECPPTFGTPPSMVQGVIAGGISALLRSREGAEDRRETAALDLDARGFSARDILVGIAASRRTPYVLGALEYAKAKGASTCLVTCSPPPALMASVDVVIAPVVGPEVVMGSTRLKAGTAQKMILNMLTTATMIRLGKVYENMMVDLQLTCGKLSERATRTVMTITGLDYDAATALLNRAGGSVKRAIVMAACGCTATEAQSALDRAGGFVRPAIAQART